MSNGNGHGTAVSIVPAMNHFVAFFDIWTPSWLLGKKLFRGVNANPLWVNVPCAIMIIIGALWAFWQPLPLWLMATFFGAGASQSEVVINAKAFGYGAAVVCLLMSVYYAGNYRRILAQTDTFRSASALESFSAAKLPVVVMFLLSFLFFGLSQILGTTSYSGNEALKYRINRVVKYDEQRLRLQEVDITTIEAYRNAGLLETDDDRAAKKAIMRQELALYQVVFIFEATVLGLDFVAFLCFMVPAMNIQYNLEQFGVYAYFEDEEAKEVDKFFDESTDSEQFMAVQDALKFLGKAFLKQTQVMDGVIRYLSEEKEHSTKLDSLITLLTPKSKREAKDQIDKVDVEAAV